MDKRKTYEQPIAGIEKKMAVMKNVRIRLENLKMDIIWIDFGSGEYRRERKNTEKQKIKQKAVKRWMKTFKKEWE